MTKLKQFLNKKIFFQVKRWQWYLGVVMLGLSINFCIELNKEKEPVKLYVQDILEEAFGKDYKEDSNPQIMISH